MLRSGVFEKELSKLFTCLHCFLENLFPIFKMARNSESELVYPFDVEREVLGPRIEKVFNTLELRLHMLGFVLNFDH